MAKITRLDVLIVYNGQIAQSASSGGNYLAPFKLGSRHESCNLAYAYFLEYCEKLHLQAGFSTSTDIIGAGRCKTYWTYGNAGWQKNKSICTSTQLFCKFSPTTQRGKDQRKLLFSSSKIKPYSNPDLFKLFFDKQHTYDKLHVHAIPTISVEKRTLKHIESSCKTLATLIKTHPSSEDYSTDIIMKDRFGAGGNHIYKFKSNESNSMLDTMNENLNTSFIIQPFANFDLGFLHNNERTSADIRLVYLGNKIVDSYIRTAKTDDFRCNQHQGGTLSYLALSKIPKNLLKKSKQIAKILNHSTSLFSLDFLMSNNGNPIFLEGNTGPGIDWNPAIKQENIQARRFIRNIVKDLLHRTSTS